MHVTACTIDAYGPLRDCSFEQLDAPVVLVHGPNEAGKTALFSFLKAMLYGIYPTAPDRHPYAPYNGDVLEGALQARLHDGSTLSVERRLRSSPYGRLTRPSGDTRTLNNETLPPVAHVSRQVYNAVYALTLGDLVTLHQQNAWTEIQDRLLGSLSVDFVRPARAVINELHDEANQLWRPDRRGKPEAQQLRKDRDQLYNDLKKARNRDETMRGLRDELTACAQRIESLEAEQKQLRTDQRRDERLRPVYTFLTQIKRNEERAGDLSSYAHIDQPENERTALQERLRALAEEMRMLTRERDTHTEALNAHTEADDTVAARAAEIEAWPQRIERIENERATLDDERQALRSAQATLEQAADCLSEPWQPEWSERVAALHLPELRSRIQHYTDAAAALRDAETQARTLGLFGEAERSFTPAVLLGVVGLTLLTIGILVDSTLSLSVGGALAAAAGAWAWHTRTHNDELGQRLDALNLDAQRREAESRADEVRAFVDDLPISPARLESPTLDLAHDLERLQQAVRNVGDARDRVEQRRERLHQERASWNDLLDATNTTALADAHDTWRAQVHALHGRLNEAQERIAAAEEAQAALPDLNERINTLQSKHDTYAAEYDTLCVLIEELGDGEWEAGVQELAERRTARRRANDARDQLQREHPDWETLRTEIEALDDTDDALSFTDEERVERTERLEALQNELREATARRAEISKELEQLAEKPTMAVLQSDIASVEADLDRVRTERDRLTLLATLIRRADHDFRMRHQPDVIQRASEHIATITGGRYERMEWREEDDRLVVYAPRQADPQPVGPPLSRGTRDQIYLALRMAIVDHLDADHESLPVFLDEVFVNWDTDRRQAGYRILQSWEGRRQVFLFTCHRPLVREAREALNAHVIQLDGPSAS